MHNDDDLNDDGYPNENTYDAHSDALDEWLDEEAAYWSEDTLDPSDSGNYDPVNGSDNDAAADGYDWDDEDYDAPAALDYDGYNDAENY